MESPELFFFGLGWPRMGILLISASCVAGWVYQHPQQLVEMEFCEHFSRIELRL
jgi:hypothetical protein